jgi:hypothetical protein
VRINLVSCQFDFDFETGGPFLEVAKLLSTTMAPSASPTPKNQIRSDEPTEAYLDGLIEIVHFLVSNGTEEEGEFDRFVELLATTLRPFQIIAVPMPNEVEGFKREMTEGGGAEGNTQDPFIVQVVC